MNIIITISVFYMFMVIAPSTVCLGHSTTFLACCVLSLRLYYLNCV